MARRGATGAPAAALLLAKHRPQPEAERPRDEAKGRCRARGRVAIRSRVGRRQSRDSSPWRPRSSDGIRHAVMDGAIGTLARGDLARFRLSGAEGAVASRRGAAGRNRRGNVAQCACRRFCGRRQNIEGSVPCEVLRVCCHAPGWVERSCSRGPAWRWRRARHVLFQRIRSAASCPRISVLTDCSSSSGAPSDLRAAAVRGAIRCRNSPTQAVRSISAPARPPVLRSP